MPSFQYKAVDPAGLPSRGKLEASNEVDLELRLKRMGLDLITVRQTRSGGGSATANINRKDLINLCFDLEQMTGAGISLLDGLRDLRDSVGGSGMKAVLTALVEDIEGGRMLSQAMGQHPKVFNGVFVSLVAAGEQSGQLTEIFRSLSESLRWQDELAAQTKKVLIYPAILTFQLIAVTVFLLVYLVPQVVSVLKTMQVDLPIQTVVLIGVSGFVVRFWWLVIGLPVLTVVAGIVLFRSSEKARFEFDRLKLRLPVIGPVFQKIILARFASFFALMYRSGITVLDAMRTSQNIAGNLVIADALQRATVRVNAGEALSEAIAGTGMFPPLVIRMLRVGEATGALDTALLNVNYFYTRDVKDSVEGALKLIEPILTLLMGGLLALILFSVLTPIYDMIGKMKF